MTNGSRNFSIALLLLVICVFPIVLHGNPPPGASIVISQPGRKPTTVTFSQIDLAIVKSDAGYIWKKLGVSNSKCCAKARRASSCIWVCCSGRKIRTCDAVLVKALEALFKEPT